MIPAIILAGGAGTRLAPLVPDVPKPMAPIRGRPFLELLLEQLIRQGVSTVVLSVGYKREVIERHFGSRWRGLEVRYCVEEVALGTGGGLKRAMTELGVRRALALNGDTFCPVDFAALQRAHQDAQLTIALGRVADASRFGAVELAPDGRVTAFRESGAGAGALVNVGVYVVEQDVFSVMPGAASFSFERDLLQRHCAALRIRGYVTDAAFVDIGIPEDFLRAQHLLP